MSEKCEHKHVGYDDEHYQYCLDCGKFANEWESSFSPAPTQAAGDGIELARAFYLKHSPSHGTVDIMAAFASEQTAPLIEKIRELKAERDALMVQIETSYCETCAEREGVFKEETAEPDSIESGVTGGQCCSRPGRGHSFDCPIADVPEDTMGRE